MLLHLLFGVHDPFPSRTWIQFCSSPTALHAQGGFNSCTLHPVNVFQTHGGTARLASCPQSLFYKSLYNIYIHTRLANSFITYQGNSKHSEDSAKSPCQYSVRHKLQTWPPSSLLYAAYLFTRFTVPLGSARPAVLHLLCKCLKL